MPSGPANSNRFELCLTATRPAFARAFDELRRGLDAMPLVLGRRLAVELVFEEVVANVLRHGTLPDRETQISLVVALEDLAVRLTFLDDGMAFDPRGRPDPAPPRDLESAEVGGRGLMLIRSVSSGIEYLRTPEGQNRLTVLVPIDATPTPKMSESAPPGG
jgi:anti-sigma regulatory factor (Ser/Thr protein kinase)